MSVDFQKEARKTMEMEKRQEKKKHIKIDIGSDTLGSSKL